MKKLMIVLVMGAMLLGPLAGQARAGDREWAVAGKVLAGLLVLDAITDTYHGTTVVYEQPVYPPPVVVYRPVVVHRPIVYRPPVVYCRPVVRRPVIVRPYGPVWRVPPRPAYHAAYRTSYRHGRRDAHWRR